MSRLATLSPIDPSVANVFTRRIRPIHRTASRSQWRTSSRTSSSLRLRASSATRTLGRVRAAGGIGAPLALGNVHRSIEQIRQLADKLIRLHSPDAHADEVEERIRRLTTASYTHSHLINRPEAESLALPVPEPSEKVEELLLAYYDELVADLELTTKFDPSKFVAAAQAGAPGAQAKPPL